MSSRAIIIGGGVIGAACAHYLVKAGWEVEIIDQGAFGKGCSMLSRFNPLRTLL